MARELVTRADEPVPEPEHKAGFLHFLKELPILIALALGIALLIKAFLVQAFYIPSASMEPTLREGDRVLVSKLSYRLGDPERWDVIVFRDPYGNPCEGGGPVRPEHCNQNVLEHGFGWLAELFGLPRGDTRDFIKRIAALPGESIEVKNGDIYIDGKKVNFPEPSSTEGPQKDMANFGPFEVPKGQYFVMGDNRGNSSDSRVFKGVKRSTVIGRAFVLVWPPTRFSGL